MGRDGRNDNGLYLLCELPHAKHISRVPRVNMRNFASVADWVAACDRAVFSQDALRGDSIEERRE